jgi:hypothetical protein
MSSPEALPPIHPTSDPGATDGPEGSDPFSTPSRDDTDGRPSRRGRREHRRGQRGGPFLPSPELGAFGPYGDRGERAPRAATSDQPAMTDGPHRGRGRHGGPPEGFDPASGQAFGPGIGRRGRGHGGGRRRGGPRPRRGDVRLACGGPVLGRSTRRCRCSPTRAS